MVTNAWSARVGSAVLGFALLACGGGQPKAKDAGGMRDASACLKLLPLDCQPAFAPEYASIYELVLLKTCGAPATGSSCHGTDGAQAGLVLADKNKAYDYLLGHVDGRARVVPGDPECSILEHRLESNDPDFRMPLGNQPLSEGQRCAIRQWIANGASKQ